MRSRYLALGAIVLASCGGSTVDSGDGGGAGVSGTGGSGGTATGGSGGTAETGGAGGVSGTGGAAGFSCPSTPPLSGSACTPPPGPSNFGDAAHCSWGDDPRPDCRTTALCGQDQTWSVTGPDASTCSAPPLPSNCPSPLPTEGSACGDPTLSCWYDDGARCWCSECAGGSPYPICQPVDPPQWACAAPGVGCPTTMPQAGAPCDVEGAYCGPSCELEIVCEGGRWLYRAGNCPICAAPDTPIATPSGERAIAELREGELVYSVEHGAIVAVPIVRAGSTRVIRHQVVRLTLATGQVLEMSPGHPTVDGRTFGDLAAGDLLDPQTAIVKQQFVPYLHDRTYDILPGSSSGVYFAAGAMVGSTLAE